MNYPTDTQRDMDAAELRRQQVEEGRRLAEAEGKQRKVIGLPAARSAAPRVAAPATGPKSKGHEAFLKALQMSDADIVVEKMSGDVYYGKLKHSDKYTLTINAYAIQRNGKDYSDEVKESFDRVIFKHDISEFHTTTAAPAGSRAAGVRA
jgi:small nuclear ribonucleoprotein (snRNP)-like protein